MMTVAAPIRVPLSGARRLGAAAALGAIILAGCAKPAPPPPPPPEVRIVTVRTQPVKNLIEVPGRLQAVRTAEVRARVDGIVQRRLYDEGTDVRAGQVLFEIDPRPLRAQLRAAEASLARAEATAANATQDVKRYTGLVAQRALSQQEYDAAVARQRTAQADVAQARAQLETARLNLAYTRVTAPITGRAGRAEVTEGAMVNAASGTLLTRIEQIDPIYVNFAQSSAELLALREQISSGALKLSGLDRVPVHVVLEDGSVYSHPGRVDFLDLRIDEATGTAALRAEVPNPERVLLPGQFVRARLEAGVQANGLLIPQRAVLITPEGSSVMVVGEKNVAESRPVTIGALQGGSWQILKGLSAGDRVIVDGLQKTRAGEPVRVATDAPAKDSSARVSR
jgi:membrane fusion protein (multidrug efflux system)